MNKKLNEESQTSSPESEEYRTAEDNSPIKKNKTAMVALIQDKTIVNNITNKDEEQEENELDCIDLNATYDLDGIVNTSQSGKLIDSDSDDLHLNLSSDDSDCIVLSSDDSSDVHVLSNQESSLLETSTPTKKNDVKEGNSEASNLSSDGKNDEQPRIVLKIKKVKGELNKSFDKNDQTCSNDSVIPLKISANLLSIGSRQSNTPISNDERNRIKLPVKRKNELSNSVENASGKSDIVKKSNTSLVNVAENVLNSESNQKSDDRNSAKKMVNKQKEQLEIDLIKAKTNVKSASTCIETPCIPSPMKSKKILSFSPKKPNDPLSFVNSISSQSSTFSSSSSANSIISSSSIKKHCDADPKIARSHVLVNKLSPDDIRKYNSKSQELKNTALGQLRKGKELPKVIPEEYVKVCIDVADEKEKNVQKKKHTKEVKLYQPRNLDDSDQNANLEFATKPDQNNNIMEYSNSCDSESLDKIYKKKFSNVLNSDSASSLSNDKITFSKKKVPRQSLTNSSNSNKEKDQITNIDQKNLSPSDHTYSKKVSLPNNTKGGSSLVIIKKNPESASNPSSVKPLTKLVESASKVGSSKIVFDPNLIVNIKPNAKKKSQASKLEETLQNSIQEIKQVHKTKLEEVKQKHDKSGIFKIPKVNDIDESEQEISANTSKETHKDNLNENSTSLNSLISTSSKKNTNESTKIKSNFLLNSSKSSKNIIKSSTSNIRQQQRIKNFISSEKKFKEKSKENGSVSILEKLNNSLITKSVSEKFKKSPISRLAVKATKTNTLTLGSFESQLKELNVDIKNTLTVPLVLLKNYTDKRIDTQNVKYFSLLDNNWPPQDNLFGTFELSREERLELCKLMTDNAGHINYFEMYEFGKESSSNNSWWMESRVNEKVASEEFRNRAFLETLNECPFNLCYELYCSFKTRISMPYKQVEAYWMSKYEYIGLHIKFENNGITSRCDIHSSESEESDSICYLCVNRGIHRRSSVDFLNINSNRLEANKPLNQKAEISVRKPTVIHSKIDSIKNTINDNKLFETFFCQEVENRCVRESGNRLPIYKKRELLHNNLSMNISKEKLKFVKKDDNIHKGFSRFTDSEKSNILNDGRRDHGVLLTKFEYKSKVTNLEKSVKINEINQDISSLFLNKGPLFR